MIKDKAFLGTQPKYLIDIQADGFDMDRDNFEVELKRGEVSKTFTKEDLPTEEYVVEGEVKNHYYVCFDTVDFGAGIVKVKVSMWIPDIDFPNGLRKIVDKFDLLIVEP